MSSLELLITGCFCFCSVWLTCRGDGPRATNGELQQVPCGRRRPAKLVAGMPDDLLRAIMSFLPVRQAVQTCVLSRRWSHLWCFMRCLNIDQREFDLAASGSSEGSRFEEFVNSLLMFHSASSLDMFRLHVTHDYESKVVERWIRRGMKCFPAMMEISNSANARLYGLPHLGSTSYRLRRLHLVNINLDNSFPRKLSYGCPVLEDLKLDRCFLDPP